VTELPPHLGIDAAELEKTWDDGKGFYCWLASTNHKRVGRRYITTAMVFFVIAGVLAGLMRLQLSRPISTISSSRCTARR
jgi:heme/copper-type cytochrome/quinol oxidase subunit 1